MGRFAEIFGFDRKRVWWYRDLALTVIAAIMSPWVSSSLLGEASSFSHRLAVGAAVVAILCWVITPNRLMLFVAVMGIVAVQGWFAVLFSHDVRSWWIAIPATLLAVSLSVKYRGKRMIQR